MMKKLYGNKGYMVTKVISHVYSAPLLVLVLHYGNRIEARQRIVARHVGV